MKIVENIYKSSADGDSTTSRLFTPYMVVVEPNSEARMFKNVTGINTLRYKHPVYPQKGSVQQWFKQFNTALQRHNDKIEFVLLEDLAAAWSFLDSKPKSVQAVFVKSESTLLLCTKLNASILATLSKIFANVIIWESQTYQSLQNISSACTVTIDCSMWNNLSMYAKLSYLEYLKDVVILYYQDLIGESDPYTLQSARVNEAVTTEQIAGLKTNTERLILTDTTYNRHQQSIPANICIIWIIAKQQGYNRYLIRANGLKEELLKDIPVSHSSISCESMPADLQIFNALPDHVTQVWLPEVPSSLQGIRDGLEIRCSTQPLSRGNTPEDADLLLAFNNIRENTTGYAASKRTRVEPAQAEIEPIHVEGDQSPRDRANSLT